MAQFKTSQMFINCLISLLWALLFRGKLDEMERLFWICNSLGVDQNSQWEQIYEVSIPEILQEEFMNIVGDRLPTMDDARLWAELRDILQGLQN